ncbi:MAG: F0F1 ATP synthase subunit A, partial [Rhodobacterales bacterium 17-64-5]
MATTEEEYAASGLQIHPMEQFVVKPLFGNGPIEWYTPTNVTLWMAIAVLAMVALMVLSTRRRAIVPSRAQSVAEMIYGFIHKMVEDVAGHEGLKFFPYVMTLFLFIFLANMLALIPTSFSTTSHIAVTAALALMVFLTVTLVGFYRKGIGFLSMFWVPSAPLILR